VNKDYHKRQYAFSLKIGFYFREITKKLTTELKNVQPTRVKTILHWRV